MRAEALPYDPEEDAEEIQMEDGRPENSSAPGRDWEPPLPLDGYQPPAFPVHLLPTPLGGYVSALAEATQVPADMPGGLCLAAVAACVQGNVIVRVTGDYTEPTSIYVAVISDPGTRKTAVAGAVTKPIEEWEAKERERLAPEIERAQSEWNIKQRRKAKLEDLAATHNDAAKRREHAQEAGTLAKELAANGPPPNYPRLLADDATPEALSRLLAEQGEKIAFLSAEGGIFETMAGRYSQSVPNLDVYLKGHAGDALRVDRRSAPPIMLRHPALTFGLAVQPDVLRGLADKPGFRGRGLIGRFLYLLPQNMMGHRKVETDPVPLDVANAYRRCVLVLLEKSAELGNGQVALGLTTDANRERVAFAKRLEPMPAPGAEFGHMGDWAGKAVGAAVRIAGLFHAIRQAHAGRAPEGDIEGDTMQAAVGLVEGYFLPHAQAALAEMGGDPETENARKVLAWIRHRNLDVVALRDLHQGLRGQGCFRKVETVAAAVGRLQQHYYLRPIIELREGSGRKPSPRYEVNPLALGPTQNAQNPTVGSPP